MQESWISAEQMRGELAASGVSITESQIERWWRQGLLPRPRQIGLGRGRGSIVMVPPDTAHQALAIHYLYGIREKRHWVGWQLWMRGFVVDERYWRPALQEAQALICGFRVMARIYQRTLGRENYDPVEMRTVLFEALGKRPIGSLLSAPLRNIPPDLFETLIGFGAEIMLGQFNGFSMTKEGESNSEELNAIIAALGAGATERHVVKEHTLNVRGVIEDRLREISAGLGKIRRNQPIAEPSIETRLELLMATGIGSALNGAFSPQFGRSALGLGLFHRIATHPEIAIQAALLLGWVELRKISNGLLSPSEMTTSRAPAIKLLRN